MDHNATISTLLSQFQQRLALGWICGEDGGQRPLHSEPASAATALVGYLNIIHPHRLQILGRQELAYLDGLSAALRADVIDQLCAASPAAILLCEELSAPDDLRQACAQSHTPLLTSACAGADVIATLRHELEKGQADTTTVHGVFLEVHGMGVLLTGDSGVGKSELALELITRHHRLIADDAAEFSRVGLDTVRGRCPEALRDFLEVRGLGILDIRAMFGDSAIKMSKDLRLIIHLQRLKADALQQLDRLQGSLQSRALLGIEIPVITLPVTTGRNLAVLVEAAVRDHILRRKGYNASEAFISRHQQLMQPTPADED
jgi:HPr kinase/phosphorylase